MPSVGYIQRQVNKTAAYTISPFVDKNSSVFTNSGASGSITFTLPTPNAALLGVSYQFHELTAQNVVISAPVADTLVAPGDAAADSAQLGAVGAGVEVTCLRTSTGAYVWVVTGAVGTVTYPS